MICEYCRRLENSKCEIFDRHPNGEDLKICKFAGYREESGLSTSEVAYGREFINYGKKLRKHSGAP